MKKIIIILLLGLFSTTIMLAQDHQHDERCGHNLYLNNIEKHLPGYKKLVDKTFKDAKEKMNNKNAGVVYTLPVVVHVVWNEPQENIDDQLIYDQIDALNEDYRALNSDFANLRSEFDAIAGDAEIEFELVHIERVQTSETFGIDFLTGGFSDATLKDSNNGGSSAWDTETYLNIWVCNIQPLAIGPLILGQILGYASPPINLADYPEINNWPPEALEVFGNPAYDGVVIHYPAFGGRDRTYTDQNLGTLSFEGRTTAHEIGHYLGLRHIWGDPDILTGQDGCTVDDGIEDTPNTANSSQAGDGCSPAANTCNDGAGDMIDMWENYMDYSDEPCQVAFTQEQVDLMRAVLEGPRSTMLNYVSTKNINSLDAKMNLSPNPTTGTFELFINSEETGAIEIRVMDILGKTVLNSTGEMGQSISLDLSNQSNGIYFVEIRKGEMRGVQKLVLSY